MDEEAWTTEVITNTSVVKLSQKMWVMNDDSGEKEPDDWWETTINKIDAKNSKTLLRRGIKQIGNYYEIDGF